jgi:hypothetical protein
MKPFRIFLLLASLYAPEPTWAQCALCRAAVESSEEGRAMAANLNRAILLLLGAPLLVSAAVAAAMLRSRRRFGHRKAPLAAG